MCNSMRESSSFISRYVTTSRLELLTNYWHPQFTPWCYYRLEGPCSQMWIWSTGARMHCTIPYLRRAGEYLLSIATVIANDAYVLVDDSPIKCRWSCYRNISPISLMCEWLKWIFLSEKFLLLNPFKCTLVPRRQLENCSQAQVTHFRVQYSVSPAESA